MSYPAIKLCYQLTGERAKDADRIKEASSHKYEIDGFSITREGEELRAVTDRYPDVESARAKPEPRLRAWEREADLYDGLRFRFDISSSQIVGGTDDGPEKSVTIFVPTAHVRVKAHLLRAEFPGLPTLTQDTDRAQMMVKKLHELEDGVGRLCAVAYSIFTEIEASCDGKIECAGKGYGISKEIQHENFPGGAFLPGFNRIDTWC